MAATLGGGGGSDTDNPLPFVHVVDQDITQATGACTAGIGLIGDDGAVPGNAQLIGGNQAFMDFVNTPPTPTPP